jgi:hypothetical protein
MKPFLLSALLSAIVSLVFAQNTCGIKKGYAWYNVSMPGMQMADEKGNPVDPKPNITRFIYVEYIGTKMPDIKAVLYNATELSFSVVAIKEKTVWVGDKKLNPNNSITAKKGNSLLKIDLQPADGKTMPDTGCKNIVIKIKGAINSCSFKLLKETAFMSLPMY